MTTQYISTAKTYENLDLVAGATNVVTVTDLSSADDQQATIDLGQNSFKFYDTVYTSLNIDSNGRITFGTSSSDYLNTDLTSNDPNAPAIIAPFWTDLKTDSTASTEPSLDDSVLYKIEGDRIIIEWNNVHFFDGGTTTDGLTFQVILQLNTAGANGKIVFNYPDLIEQNFAGNNGATATVGVKAPGSQTTSIFDRTLVSFNETNALVGNSKAIEFTPTLVDPATPVITSAPTIDFAENGTGTVYTVTATAPQGATLTYGLSGTDANLFNIDINSGIVTFKTAPDFEIPTDSGANNIYDINVIANNGTLSNSQALAITVTNVNEVVSNTQYIATAKTYENLDLVSGATNVVTVTDLSSADDQEATINLGQNSFKFYDTVYTSLNIDSNGRITFGTSSSDYLNTDLTSNDPNAPAIIAPFWTDLKTDSTASTEPSLDDSVLYKIEGDRIIIEWNNVHFFDGGTTTDGLTFQVILQLNTAGANGKIVFNYPDLIEQNFAGNNGATATVGVKAPGSQTTSIFDRTLVSFNETNALVGNSKAIEFTPVIRGSIPVISLAVSADVVEDGVPNLVYTFIRTGDVTNALTVNYNVGGTATFNNDYTQTGADTFTASTGTVNFAANATTATVTVDPTADTTFEPDETVILTLASGTGYTIDTAAPVTGTIINDDPVPETKAIFSKGSDDIFNLTGLSTSKLKVSFTDAGSNSVNEIGFFSVDDATGKIGSFSIGSAGYAQAALERSKVIFSAIANKPSGYDPTNTSLIEATGNLRFYLLKSGTTTEEALRSSNSSNIQFSTNSAKITDLGSGSFTIAWDDGSGSNGFKSLAIKVEGSDDPLAIGTKQQGNSFNGKGGGEVIDLRFASGLAADTKSVNADFVVNREAAYNNFVGFYKVTDTNGGIDTNGDGLADFTPGQSGYIQAAVQNRVAGIDLAVSNQGSASMAGKTFEANSIFAPFIIVNGNTSSFAGNNTSNAPTVYFSYLGANTDGVDHIRQLGSNTFGFEDLAGGGDRDFNDIIIKATLTAVK